MMTITRIHLVGCFLASACMTSALVIPRVSKAMSMTAHACKPFGQTWPANSYQTSGFVVQTPPPGQSMVNELICPIADEDEEGRWYWMSVNVGVYDNSTSSSCQIYACSTSWFGAAVACGPSVVSGTQFTGFTQLTLTPTEFADPWDPIQHYWDFGWIGVSLNPNAGSKLIGLIAP